MSTTTPQRVEIRELRGKIDFGIMTFREDEFMAVLKRMQPKWVAFGNWHYNVAEVAGNELYYAAIVRTYEQGQSDTQQVANYLINELDPSCLILVGIAGGKPESEFTLGDSRSGVEVTRFQPARCATGWPQRADKPRWTSTSHCTCGGGQSACHCRFIG
jgi:hypothetical protein